MSSAGDPGDPGWKWFPGTKDGWSFDVVTLLAVIGESSIAEHAPAITASKVCWLPRIVPAPQALLKPSRPVRMPEFNASLMGVYSGVNLDSVGFFANLITPLDELPAQTFQVWEIKHAKGVMRQNGEEAYHKRRRPWDWLRRLIEHGGQMEEEENLSRSKLKRARPMLADVEAGSQGQQPDGCAPKPLARRDTKGKLQDKMVIPSRADHPEPPVIPPDLLSPIHFISAFSFLVSIAILVMACVWKDGVAILAVTLVSFASSVVGWASSWRPVLAKRTRLSKVPKGDVIIRTRGGTFILVKCTEEVARELYSGTDRREYRVGDTMYRSLMALGTTLLMIGVVLLGNCTWNSQIFIGVSYIVLNGLYWGMGMIPKKKFWDLSRYEYKCVTPKDSKDAHKVPERGNLDHHSPEDIPSFTRTLWYVIRETRETRWVLRSGAAPKTDKWKKWLEEARRAAVANDRSWSAVQRKDDIMAEKTGDGENEDAGGEYAPAAQVSGMPDVDAACSSL